MRKKFSLAAAVIAAFLCGGLVSQAVTAKDEQSWQQDATAVIHALFQNDQEKPYTCPSASTAGQSICDSKIYGQYDVLLNHAYKAAIDANSDPATKQALRDAQRKWLAFRDADNKAEEAWRISSDDGKGSDAAIVTADHDLGQIRERIFELMMFTGAESG